MFHVGNMPLAVRWDEEGWGGAQDVVELRVREFNDRSVSTSHV